MVKTSSKSSHHKDTNRFKFESFSERIAHINIDVIHRSKKTHSEPQDADSFFAEGLAKWRDLNCTQDFVDFSREISHQVQSFAQLVHFEEQIVSSLQTHLKIPNSMAYIPLLDLVVQLARDLQTDFYPHFKDFFEIVVSLLDTQDTELIEGAFQCLCYMFKFLWRYLVRDIEDVYSMYSPLLAEDRKEHVRRFAAESFAFIMRKVKDHGKLFDFMLSTLKDNPQQAKGLGHLLFDMLKGVRHQTHSSTERILPVLLHRLGPCRRGNDLSSDLPWILVLECFKEMFSCLTRYLKREYTEVVWNALLNEASFLEGQDGTALQLNSIMKLLDQTTKYGNGSLIMKPRLLCQSVISSVGRQSLPECYGKTLLSLVSSLLQATRGDIHQEDISSLIKSVFESNYGSELVFDFSRSIFHISSFEQDVLPGLCEYCHSKMAAKDLVTMDTMLLTLTDLISSKQSSIDVGSSIVNYKPYILDFSRQIHISKGKRKGSKLHDVLSVPGYLKTLLEYDGDDSKNPVLWAALQCITHVRPIDRSECCKKLQKTVSSLHDAVIKLQPHENEPMLYILYQAIQSLLVLSRPESPTSVLSLESILSLLRHHSSSPSMLLAADCYLSLCTDSEILTADTLTSLYAVLEHNLSSPYSQVRRLTLRILDTFPVTLPPVEDMTPQPVSVFRLCLEAEEVPVAIETYRDKLKCLGLLQYGTVKHHLPNGFEMVPLRFLLGQLYVNFQLLWEPVADIIKSHAYGMEKTMFWSVYSEALNNAAKLNEDNLFYHRSSSFHQTLHSALKSSETESSNMEELFLRCYGNDTQTSDRPDHVNLRRLLWKTMEGFVEKAEGRSRELSPLLLRFIKNEFYVTDVNSAPTQDLRQVKGQTSSQSEDGEDEIEDQKGKKKRPVNKSLLAHLNLFSKYKDPKSLYLEPQLKELYMNLLSSRNADIQKVALCCLYTYNYKYVTPYREQLDELMDEKLFRDALVHFGIDETSGVLDPLHREGLLPILFRILYGKMLSKTSPGSQGKGGISTRRSVILRFIAGSNTDEMKVFMDLVMEPCKHLIKDDIHAMRSEWLSQDLSAIVPLRKQHSMLDTVGVIFSKLGHLIDSYRPLLFRVMSCAVASYNQLLSCRDQLQPFCTNQLKNLRQISIQRLIEFFGHFDDYPFSKDEIEIVFVGAVYPQLDQLTSQSLGAPAPLLRLAHTWSLHTRYHPLLLKSHANSPNVTLLQQSINLLSAPKVGQSVVTMVMDIVENLLMVKEDEEEEDGIPGVSLDNLTSKPGGDLSLGACMLLPHVPAILNHLNAAIKIQHKPGSKSTPTLPVKELGILYKLSGFVEASDLCSSLVGLLLPYLQKTTRLSENTEIEILSTIKNLMKLIEDTSCFLNPLSRLLYRTTSRTSRIALVQIFSAMATRDSSLDEIARTVSRINSWDRKRLDEPDYTLRLKAFKLANQMLEDEQQMLDVRFFTPLIHNCFYFILKMDDMSMRDNASHMISGVIKKLQKDESAFVTIIEHTFIPALRDGLRAKTEVARHESLAILSQLVQAFPTHPHFDTMAVLLDKDVEVDFFENIRHIQHHRRMRALRRLSKHCQEGELSAKVVQHFLLPTATSMIFDPEVAKNMNLVVEAIAAVGGMASVLSWSQYLGLLTQYLRLLMRSVEFQKIAVRLIVSVLDAFHFDLSLSTGLDIQTSSLDEKKEQDGKTKEDENGVTKEDEDDVTNDDEDDVTKEEDDDDGSGDDDSGIDEEKDKSEVEKRKQVALATKIHRTIVRSILPQLHKIITKKTRSEGEHKRARNKMAQDEEVLRVPIALAVIKLLQALPKETMDQHLYSVLLKVCQMLRSRAMDVRNITRDTLVKILDSLGVKYFGLILKQMKTSLTRGFELHVLGYTIHLLLKSISPKLKSGDLDSCLDSLLQVFNQELFGAVSEEKEVEGIVGKLFEARSIKAYDCYEVVSKFVGQGSITRLIAPLKEILDRSNSHRAVNRVRETLRRTTIGLQENSGISQDALLIFIHGLTSETLPLIKPPAKNEKKDSLKPNAKPASTYLIPPKPTRAGLEPETSTKTHIHLLIEFGLQLLNMSLKRSKFVASNNQHMAMLDPFTSILYRCMEAQHTRVITYALRCLCWVLRYPLPSLSSLIKQLTQSLFKLLRKHARVGAAKGDNFELMVVTFKAVTVLIRDVKHYSINEKQLQVLLAYAEEDIHDYTRQATAFTMLKAILTRKLVAPEIHGIMGKISQLSITQQSSAVRLQCRQVMHQFLLDYPLGKKLKRHLEFYVKQLSFSVESGRESALEMLATIFSSFPQKLLVEHAGLFYIPMATRLVNDDSANCRKLTALALITLLDKLSLEKRDELFSITLHWLQDTKPSHQRLAAQLIAVFVEAEKQGFSRRLSQVIPIIDNIIKPDNLVEEDVGEENEVKAQDHLMFHVMSALCKITKQCQLATYKDQPEIITSMWESLESHLLHPHSWVRLMAARLFGELFASYQPHHLVATATGRDPTEASSITLSSESKKTKKKKKTKKDQEQMIGKGGGDDQERTVAIKKMEYLHGDLSERMMGLADKYCKQLNSSLVSKELAEQVIKNLIFISKVVHRLNPAQHPQEIDDKEEEEDDKKIDDVISISWMLKRMSRIAATEVAKTPKITLKRMAVIKWMAATALDIGQGSLRPYLPIMLHVVGREVNDRSAQTDPELKTLCQEVLELLKSLMGLDVFSEVYAAVQRDSNETRLARKRKRALEAVADPEKTALRKMKKQQLKKDSRKRKLQIMRPTYHINKRPKQT